MIFVFLATVAVTIAIGVWNLLGSSTRITRRPLITFAVGGLLAWALMIVGVMIVGDLARIGFYAVLVALAWRAAVAIRDEHRAEVAAIREQHARQLRADAEGVAR